MEFGDPRAGRDPCKDYIISATPYAQMTPHSPRSSLFCRNCADSLKRTRECRWNCGLHADLDSFEGTETNIRDEFCRSRTCEVDRSLVLPRIFLAGQLRVEVFEVLVEPIFGGSLHRVAKEGWGPTCEDPTNTFSAADQAPCLNVALIQVGVDLSTTLDQIERGNRGMRGALSRSDRLHPKVSRDYIHKRGYRRRCKRRSTCQSTTRCLQPLPEPSRLLSRTAWQQHLSIHLPSPWPSQCSQRRSMPRRLAASEGALRTEVLVLASKRGTDSQKPR